MRAQCFHRADFRGFSKTGCCHREVIREVARFLRRQIAVAVVDPVMRATSGDDLIDDNAVECLISDIFPLAVLVTPNIPEAERLTGFTIGDEQTMREAAKRIRELGAHSVLVKGGHLLTQRQAGKHSLEDEPLEAIDVLNEEGRFTILRAELISGGEVQALLRVAAGDCLSCAESLREALYSKADSSYIQHTAFSWSDRCFNLSKFNSKSIRFLKVLHFNNLRTTLRTLTDDGSFNSDLLHLYFGGCPIISWSEVAIAFTTSWPSSAPRRVVRWQRIIGVHDKELSPFVICPALAIATVPVLNHVCNRRN